MTTTAPAAPAAASAASEQRLGTIAGAAAYGCGASSRSSSTSSRTSARGEILLHRILWSFVVVSGLLALRRDGGGLRRVRSTPHGL